jgi:4-hydroxythreonine-4-phosphate dehydrogenase
MKSLIGITMGCPVGIGPEILLKFFASLPDTGNMQPVVLGDIGVMRHAGSNLGLPAEIVPWQPGNGIENRTIPVYNLSSLESSALRWGRPDKATGRAMAVYIEEAVRLCREGVLAGMVTCPITKKALNMAGYAYPGHTEMLADLTGTENYFMMMAGRQLKVVLVTIHEPLNLVAGMISTRKIEQCITMTAQALHRDFGMENPRLGVAGLNPHGGEQGMFGREEPEIIAPAVLAASNRYSVSGPWAPDTVFYHPVQGRFDAVIAMYHDQGLIPFKLLHFSDGVNVTLGLPIVRTSVDHGTAYDIAGHGIADSSSLEAAYFMAEEIIANRNRGKGQGQ